MNYLASPSDPHGDAPAPGAHRADAVSDALAQRTRLWTLTGALGLAVGALCLRLLGDKGNPAWLLLVVIATGLLVLLMQFFEWGVIAFIAVAWIAVGTPEVAQGGSGSGQRLLLSQLGLILLLILWVFRRLITRRIDWVRAPVMTPIVLYLSVCLFSTIVGLQFPNAAVLAHSVKQYPQVNFIENLLRWLSLGGLVLCANTFRGRSLRVAMAVMVVPGLVTFSGILPLPVNSYMAFPQIIAMAILGAYAVGDNTPWWRRILFAAITLTIFGVFFIKGAQWVSGWLGGLVALSVVTFWGRRPLFLTGLGLAVLIVLANFSYFYKSVYTDNFYGDGPTHDVARKGEMGEFTNDRTRMLAASFRYASEFPLGIGLGNYRSYNTYFGRVDVWNTTTFTSAHGSYAQALSETGWPGLICLLVLLYSSGRTLKKTWRNLPPGGDRNWALGAWGGVTGVFVASFNGDYLFPSYHNGGVSSFGATMYTWLTIGVAVALARQYGLVKTDALAPPHTAAATLPAAPPVHPLWGHGIRVLRAAPLSDRWRARRSPAPTPAPATEEKIPSRPAPFFTPTPAVPAPVFRRAVSIERPLSGMGSPRERDVAPQEEKP